MLALFLNLQEMKTYACGCPPLWCLNCKIVCFGNIEDTSMVDLIMNVVERPSGGFSAGGGISSGITSGPLSGLIGSFVYSHRNVFGTNQKLNISLERGQIDSIFRINYIDPWIEGDEKRTSRTMTYFSGSGKTHDDMLIAKFESVYTGSGNHGSSMFVFNMEQGLPVLPEWLFFNRVNAHARKGVDISHARLLLNLSGGHLVGNFSPHEAFAIGGTNSVRGYEEGAVGSGRSYVVGSGEISFPMLGPAEGVIFSDHGTELGSGPTVPARLKPGSGYGHGFGIRVNSPLGPVGLEYAFNDRQTRRFHFGVGHRNLKSFLHDYFQF